MRLWTIHPKYLDAKGLTALWREALLARKVLKGKTSAYSNHPQLIRFREFSDPLNAINTYLYHVWKESCSRGYCFDSRKIAKPFTKKKLSVAKGQIDYEFRHLLKKLHKRDRKRYLAIKGVKRINVHPLFSVRKGSVESWERL